jgi:predicted ribosomally synthesized peptide with SipW-like signal peptide
VTRRLLLTIVVVAAVAAACGAGTFAAFSSSTSSPSNSFSAGTVSITDSHTGSTALVGLTNAAPAGTTASGCIAVTYGGSLPATVRMYATGVSGAALTPYLKVTVTRGSWSGAAPVYPSCTGFVTTGESNYIGAGTGITFSGMLNALPTSWATASNDPVGGTTEQWTNGEAHVYKVDVQLDSSAPAGAQGQTANAAFTWEAQNQ